MEKKRLFFGVEVDAPWPDSFPAGRLLDPHHRHLTLAFLGEVETEKIQIALKRFPKPEFKVGFGGQFDRPLFLPSHHPHVVAWGIKWLEEAPALLDFQKKLVAWLKEEGFSLRNDREFLAHVTIARSPFAIKEWKHAFSPLPVMLKNIHLFESLGNSVYNSVWHYPIETPFIEIEHTADIAFLIHAEKSSQLFDHAQLALSFVFPPLLQFVESAHGDSLDEIVFQLNQIIAKADSEIGCPFKAVSYHGTIKKGEILTWEMIVDV